MDSVQVLRDALAALIDGDTPVVVAGQGRVTAVTRAALADGRWAVVLYVDDLFGALEPVPLSQAPLPLLEGAQP